MDSTYRTISNSECLSFEWLHADVVSESDASLRVHVYIDLIQINAKVFWKCLEALKWGLFWWK